MGRIKNRILLTLIIFIIAIGCELNKTEYDPEEVIFSINHAIVEDHYTVFLVIENESSEMLAVELVSGKNILERGDKIVGDKINLHFVYTDEFSWKINSYYQVAVGKNMDQLDMVGGGSSDTYNNYRVNISFSDIPEFDVATRSAHYPLHCHTSDSLEVPCANIGGNTYYAGENFYVCLQTSSEAGYVLTKVPEVENYTISLGELNTDMTKYTVLNTTNYSMSVGVRAFGSDGGIEIYNMGLPREKGVPVDVFVPNSLPQMKTFSTTIDFFNEDNRIEWSSAYVSDVIEINPSHLDVGLEITHSSGNLPLISTINNEFDYLCLDIRQESNFWTIYSANGKDIYLPEFPDEMYHNNGGSLKIQEALTDFSYVNATAFQDSRFSNYEDAVDYYLKIRTFESENRSNLTQRAWIIDY